MRRRLLARVRALAAAPGSSIAVLVKGEISQKKGDKKAAKDYFEEVKKKSNRKDEAWKDAKRRLKALEKGD
jgi:hypothetical protein